MDRHEFTLNKTRLLISQKDKRSGKVGWSCSVCHCRFDGNIMTKIYETYFSDRDDSDLGEISLFTKIDLRI